MIRIFKNLFILIYIFILVISGFSQNYQIGNRTITFYDPARSRNIPSRIYYPSNVSGSNVSPAQGVFPLIVFGHGFLMDYSAYLNFVDHLVPKGYIICLPTTEGGIPPSHENFALDLKFVNDEIKTQSLSNLNFFLYQRVSDTSALMGHSMGGGCAFVAAANNTNLKTLVTFAAAETNVSAIQAAFDVIVPTLVFAGENDGMTPPTEHQLPMYNNLTVDCKGYISIKGGGHCYFANYNLACATGEATTSPQPTISREQQHQAIFNALLPYLEWQLKGNNSKRQEFETVIANAAVYSSEFVCNSSLIKELNNVLIQLIPEMSTDILRIINYDNDKFYLTIINVNGKIMKEIIINENSSLTLDLRSYHSSIYFLYFRSTLNSYVKRVIKL